MIRDVGAEDVAAIRAVAEAAYAPFVTPIGRRPAPMDADFAAQVAAGQVRVAGADGFCVSYANAEGWHVENLAVRPASQGAGFGIALLEDAERLAREACAGAVHLYTNVAMTEALAFYPRRGYVETGRRREAGFDRAYFRKVLEEGPR